MRATAAILLATVLLLLPSGCTSLSGRPTRVPEPGGLAYHRATFDGPPDSSEASEALGSARTSIDELTVTWFEYDGSRPPTVPDSAETFARQVHLELVPVFEYRTLDASAESVYDITRPQASEYVLMSLLDGSLVGGCDWYRPGADEAWRPGPWFSFYGLGGLEFPDAVHQLETAFGNQPMQVRIVGVPRGWWVVGRASGIERAVFVCHQGACDDDPRHGRIYSLQEVLDYGTPHAFGE